MGQAQRERERERDCEKEETASPFYSLEKRERKKRIRKGFGGAAKLHYYELEGKERMEKKKKGPKREALVLRLID